MSGWRRLEAFAIGATTPLLLAGCTLLAIGAADRSSLQPATLVERCPLGVPWTTIHVDETSEGVELDFSTSWPPNVDQLRRRVRDQTRAYGPNRQLGSGHDGEHHGPRDHGLRLWTMGELVTRVEDTPTGAKLTIAPADAARRDEVRDAVTRRVARLKDAGCPR
jgi:hypothetical protein